MFDLLYRYTVCSWSIKPTLRNDWIPLKKKKKKEKKIIATNNNISKWAHILCYRCRIHGCCTFMNRERSVSNTAGYNHYNILVLP